MHDIGEIYRMLNWKNPLNIQLEGIKLAQSIQDLSLLIQPPAEASVWERCADIICEKSDAVLEPYLDELLEWLQDLNWPGALAICERLKTFSGDLLKKHVISAVDKAEKMSNGEGTQWLVWLSELLDNNELKKELPEEVIEKLQKQYY